MPLYIRKLPCQAGLLVPQDKIPPGQALYNPSRAGEITCIRNTHHTQSGEVNFALLHDARNNTTQMVASPWEQLAPHVNMFSGIEDLRIVEWNGRLWFGGTCTHATMAQNNELIVGFFTVGLDRVERVQRVDIGSRPVKNVCPFVHNGQLLLLDIYLRKIYRFVCPGDDVTAEGPWTVEVERELTLPPGLPTTKFRGSTSPIHLHGGVWACVIHDIIFNDNSRLVTRLSYIHHWLEFNIDSGTITFISTPFFLAHWGIEYVSGIHVEGEKILLYSGVDDRLPMRAETTLADLRSGK